MDNQEPKEEKLNPNQELFCKLYATEKEFFGNGVESYVEAYNVDKSKPNWYKSACSSASRLLGYVKVIARINNILEQTGFNDAFIDKELSFLIAQHADFTNKLGAIKKYNKLKQRIVDKSEVKVDFPKPLLANLNKDALPNNDSDSKVITTGEES